MAVNFSYYSKTHGSISGGKWWLKDISLNDITTLFDFTVNMRLAYLQNVESIG